MNAISDRLSRSWQIFKHSVRVIREHPKLLVFPLATGLLTFGIALFFLLPVALALLAPHWVGGSGLRAVAESIGLLQLQQGGNYNFAVGPLGTAILTLMYLVNMFLATLGSVAFSSEILEALGGRPVSIRHGIAVACSRWKSVLLWSLLAGIVGILIRAVEERLAFVGRIIAGFIGLAWSVASIFAIPILVREASVSNPFTVLSHSATTIKRTWGELLAGYVGMKGTNLLFLFGSIVFWLGAGGAAIVFSNPWVLAVAAVIWLPVLLAYSYLASVASRVYLCALYLYASEGVVPGPYDASMMDMGWKLKKGGHFGRALA